MSPSRLTPREREVLDHLTSAWNTYLLLPKGHPDEVIDLRGAIHAAQRIVAARVARRVEPDIWVGGN